MQTLPRNVDEEIDISLNFVFVELYDLCRYQKMFSMNYINY